MSLAANSPKGNRLPRDWVLPFNGRIVSVTLAMNPLSATGDAASVTVRRMTSADVPTAMELKNIAGWNQTPDDWRGYLAFEPDGCFVAEVDGRAIGTATSIRYGNRFGWIGMVLVHPDARRLGIGTKLLRHAIDYLQRSGAACVKLDATPMGRKVYVPLGFEDEFALARYEGNIIAGAREGGPAVRPLVHDDLSGIEALDTAAFGADRRRVLAALSQRNPEWCFVSRRGTGITGYLIAREGHGAVQLGPWVAGDAARAENLFDAFCARTKGQRVFVDVPLANTFGCALLQERGFVVQRRFIRMHLGPNLHPGIPGWIFGGSGAEKG